MAVIDNSTIPDTQPPITSTANVQDGSFDSVNAVVLPIFATLAIIIIYMPMYDFFRKRNFAMCSMIVATTILNLYCLVNVAIWHNDDWDTWWSGEGLCDIEVNTRYMMSTVLLTSMACFTKNLADVFNTDKHSFIQTSAMKRRKLLIDILFCWGVPVLQIALHYVASAGRYAIQPTWGCDDSYDNSWPFLVFYFIPNPIFTLLSGYYAIRVLIGLHQHRSNLSSTIASSGSGMSTRYFVKLAIIAISLVIIWLPAQGYWLYRQRPIPFHSYNWDSLHDPASWNPIIFYHNSDDPFMQYNGWTSVALSMVIFAYFGFNNDAINKYRSWLATCGLGKIWPSLKEPRLPRRRRSNRSSLSTHFDLVSKAMQYFDGSRKNKRVSSPEATQSCKDSRATFDHISLVKTDTNNATPTSGSLTTSTIPDVDVITPAPAITPKPSFSHHSFMTSQGSPESSMVLPHRTFFSSFRTHINLPFPLFTTTAPPAEVTTGHIHDIELPNIDVESQRARAKVEMPLGRGTVETNICSNANSPFPKQGPRDSDGLRMGTRAYRERERRKMEAESASGVVVNKMERGESDEPLS